MKRLIPILVMASTCSVAVSAKELRPLENYSVHFGDVSGSVYVDQANAVSRIVATLSGGAEAAPVRFAASLSNGQSVTVSVPRGVGQPAFAVTFERRGDHVFVDDAETVVGSIK